jgi:hypothetical protein
VDEHAGTGPFGEAADRRSNPSSIACGAAKSSRTVRGHRLFDYSESRDEVIFREERRGLDIGLLLATAARRTGCWPIPRRARGMAPRGHKVSYIVRAKLGDVVRTLHPDVVSLRVTSATPRRFTRSRDAA